MAKVSGRSAKPRSTTTKGPLSLTQAQAIIGAKKSRRAAAADAVGNARTKARDRRAAEMDRHLREYTETMRLLQRHGARAAAPPAGGPPGLMAEAATSFVPLRVFAEGDSWFNYPPHLLNGGIITRLQRRIGVPILNLATPGDEVRYMLGVEQQKTLARYLRQGSPAGGLWDALLFSGGGNDIVGDPLALWIKQWDPTIPLEQHINQPRFDHALGLIRSGYEELISLRDALSPQTHLIFQGYDFAIANGEGVCFLGPWLKPAFDLRKFPNIGARNAVVRAMLQQFAAMLANLAAGASRVTFINGQGTLPQRPASWHNELHPSDAGFDLFADLFRQTLKQLFPDRVV